MKRHLSLLSLIAAAALVALGFSQPIFDNPRLYFGEEVAVGEGTARTFVRLSDDGDPEAVGLMLTEAALQNLPATMPVTEYVLGLPKDVAVAPFDHLTLDWNPQGHEPEGIYTAPHFDVHFYMIDAAARDLILPSDPAFEEKGARMPEAQYLPIGYFSPPENLPVPRMGTHFINKETPELHGHAFDKTFIYGFYDGQMVFIEPMVAMEYLKTKPDVTEVVAQPEAFASAGYYPTHYSVRYDEEAKTYAVALEGLTYHEAVSTKAEE